jgi:hypothetical protein
MEFSYGYDFTNFPLVILTTEGIPTKDSQIISFLDDWTRLYKVSIERNKKYKLLFDVRKTNSVAFNYLMMIAKFLIKMKQSTEQWMDRTAILVSNPTIKTLIACVFKVYHPVRPFKVFNVSSDAVKWLMSTESGDDEYLMSKLLRDVDNENLTDDEESGDEESDEE